MNENKPLVNLIDLLGEIEFSGSNSETIAQLNFFLTKSLYGVSDR